MSVRLSCCLFPENITRCRHTSGIRPYQTAPPGAAGDVPLRSIRIPDDLWEAAESAAEAADVERAELVRRAIADAVRTTCKA